MLLPNIGALLLAASTASAFKNTSPFLLLSSDPLPKDAPLQSAQIALTKDVEDRLVEMLSDCDKDVHIFQHKQMSANDLREGAMPKLSSRTQGLDADRMIQIPEVMVMGELSPATLAVRVDDICEAKGKKIVQKSTGIGDYDLLLHWLEPCPSSKKADRFECLAELDKSLDADVEKVLENRESSRSSMLIYITTPPILESHDMSDNHLYEMDDPYPSALHTDLKRDLHEIRKRQSDNSTDMQAGLGLFEKYQFFTPGLFMGLTVSVGLVAILYVGISAISGLQVSYMAFNKEMGPQAQKGKQQ